MSTRVLDGPGTASVEMMPFPFPCYWSVSAGSLMFMSVNHPCPLPLLPHSCGRNLYHRAASMPPSTTNPPMSHRLVRGFESIRRKLKLGADGVPAPLLKAADVEKPDRCAASGLLRSVFPTLGWFIVVGIKLSLPWRFENLVDSVMSLQVTRVQRVDKLVVLFEQVRISVQRRLLFIFSSCSSFGESSSVVLQRICLSVRPQAWLPSIIIRHHEPRHRAKSLPPL